MGTFLEEWFRQWLRRPMAGALRGMESIPGTGRLRSRPTTTPSRTPAGPPGQVLEAGGRGAGLSAVGYRLRMSRPVPEGPVTVVPVPR